MRMVTNDLRHNELITGISLLSVLKDAEHLSLSKILLIEPLLSYKKVRYVLCHESMRVQSIEELMLKEKIFFANFSDRYYEKLDLTFNAVQLFTHMGLFRILNGELSYNGDGFNFSENLGSIAEERIRASRKLAEILRKGNANEMYLSLRIEI